MAREKVVSATEFKAKCLSLLDEVQQSRTAITITKRGVPVAVVRPTRKKAWKFPLNAWAGKAEIVGDIVNTNTADLWEVVSGKPDI